MTQQEDDLKALYEVADALRKRGIEQRADEITTIADRLKAQSGIVETIEQCTKDYSPYGSTRVVTLNGEELVVLIHRVTFEDRQKIFVLTVEPKSCLNCRHDKQPSDIICDACAKDDSLRQWKP